MRNWQRLRWPAVVVAVLLAEYVGVYAYLSRRGMAEAEAAGWSYFFYCPLGDLEPHENLPWQHRLALTAFDPLHQIDRAWFGGREPCHGVTWGIAK